MVSQHNCALMPSFAMPLMCDLHLCPRPLCSQTAVLPKRPRLCAKRRRFADTWRRFERTHGDADQHETTPQHHTAHNTQLPSSPFPLFPFLCLSFLSREDQGLHTSINPSLRSKEFGHEKLARMSVCGMYVLCFVCFRMWNECVCGAWWLW